MISVLLPSRCRPQELSFSLDSLELETNDIEALIWLDDDEPKVNAYDAVLHARAGVRTFVKPRVGYRRFDKMVNFLCEQAKGEWLFLWNDDAYMTRPDWHKQFEKVASRFKPLEEPVVLNLWGQGGKQNLFPIVSRKFVDILGHFSQNTACDDWAWRIGSATGIQHDIFGIKPAHRKAGGDPVMGDLIDETYREIEDQRKRHRWWGLHTSTFKKLLAEDIEKINQWKQQYENNRQDSPSL